MGDDRKRIDFTFVVVQAHVAAVQHQAGRTICGSGNQGGRTQIEREQVFRFHRNVVGTGIVAIISGQDDRSGIQRHASDARVRFDQFHPIDFLCEVNIVSFDQNAGVRLCRVHPGFYDIEEVDVIVLRSPFTREQNLTGRQIVIAPRSCCFLPG